MSLSSKPFTPGIERSASGQPVVSRYTFPELGTFEAPRSFADQVMKNPEFHRIRFQQGHEILPQSIESAREDRRLEVEQSVAQARVEAQEIRDRAREEGLAAGRKEGWEAAQREFTAILKSLGDSIEGLNAYREQMRHEAEQEALELALAIARKVVSHEVTINPETITHVIRNALSQITESCEIRIRLHSTDFKLMSDHWSMFRESLGRAEGVHFEADDAVGRGGCMVETDFGGMDARIGHQLEMVENALRSLLT